MRRRPAAAVLGLALLVLSGCSMVELGRELSAAADLGLITGRVESPAGGTEGVVVALFRDTESGPLLEAVDRLSSVLTDYVFVLDASTPYLISAFHDLDSDLIQDPEEPAAILGRPDPIVVVGDERLSGRQIVLREKVDLPADLRFDPAGIDLPALDSIPVAAGEIIDLEDERFSPEQAKRGMWSPLTAAREVGGGIYFLDRLDAGRLPVLFVHGIQGSPRDFTFLIESLDRERYQPWLFHYPSGIRLGRTSQFLARLVLSLHREQGFERLAVVAHSMGGLVARSALLQIAESEAPPGVSAFVTLSTPWAGHWAAAQGVKYSPAVVPSWVDVQPESVFLSSLQTELDVATEHHLFFGFDTQSSLLMLSSHDTVVTVSSQLAPWFQRRAKRTYGYDRDHAGILEDAEVAAQLTAILDRVSRGGVSGSNRR